GRRRRTAAWLRRRAGPHHHRGPARRRALYASAGHDRSGGRIGARPARQAVSRRGAQAGRAGSRTARRVLARHARAVSRPLDRRNQLVGIYRYLRLTRTLEERLVALYRQSKVIGGLFRSLGQEGESVASAYALQRGRNRDILSPLIRNLGSMLVMGAQPIQILRQYM